ncbi:MAG: T9SS type A sorting domain-containing protein [Saprospiraceae bacterium]
MKNSNFLFMLAFLFASVTVNAQFEFKIDFDFDSERYIVSVIPQESYSEPQNITSDGQVTIKAPTNRFIPVEIKSELQGMIWDDNSRIDAPEEAPDFDYISFALQISSGVAYPEYEVGVPLPLFSFKNAYGCTAGNGSSGVISIIDNDNDPFMPPNSANANIGNALSVLGGSSFGGYGFSGLYNGGSVSCDPENPTSTAEKLGFSEFRVFPNPVAEVANVEISWEGESQEAYLQMVDPAGKLILQQPVSIAYGKNTVRLQVAQYPAGSYFLYLVGEDWEVSLDKINKQ